MQWHSNQLAAEPWAHLSSRLCSEFLQLPCKNRSWEKALFYYFQEGHSQLKETWEPLKLRKPQNILKANFLSVSVILALYLDFTVPPEASFSYIVHSCSKFTPLDCSAG